jgi:hyaluronan synthase
MAEEQMNPGESRGRRSWLLAGLGFFPLVGALISVLWMAVVPRGADGRETSTLHAIAAIVMNPIGAIVLLQSLYVGLQSLLWQKYAPVARPARPCWPRVSVVIPAFNEGPMVERSILSVVGSGYPHELLEIIVVDDGSRDDTFFHMQRLRREHPGVIKLVRFAGNQGKRAALAAAFRSAEGEILLTIDSDSVITPGTVHEMVTPFLAHAEVGAVAGRVSVLNRDSIISRMLEVQFALAFDFARAAQSTFRSVACCPGALSAFRRELVVPYLDEWTHQTFLGRPVGHGEDQALTNIILRQGYDTVYQRTAVVQTLAPTTYRQMTRMLVRWERSYIVEGMSFAKFMFTRYREKNRVLPIVHFVVANLRIVVFAWGFLSLPLVFTRSGTVLAHSAAALLVGTLFTALYYLRVERSLRFLYGVLYAVYSLFLLQWILPWALLTVRDERWGTR